MKKQSSVILLLLLVIVIAVLSIFIMRRKPEAAPEPTASAAPVSTPETGSPSAQAPTDAPIPTTPAPPQETAQSTTPPVFEPRPPVPETPVPETPEPTPDATEPPEETPAPIAETEGSFTSNTGTGLNLQVHWHTYGEAGVRKLRVDVSAASYSFHSAALNRAITLTVGGTKYTADSPAINYDGDAQISTPLASFTMDAPASGSEMTVVWGFKGTYSGKEINSLTASGTLND